MQRLAAVLEAVSGTASKLEKTRLLADYLSARSDAELRLACTYLTGSTFPAGDFRKLNVGWSAIIDALFDVSGAPPEALDQSYLQHGDLGTVAYELLSQKSREGLLRTRLTLMDVDRVFSQMSAAEGKGSRQAKLQAMRALFADADALEAKYLVRIITSDMRVGLKEGLLEEAIAKAFSQPLTDVRRANMLISDIGEVVVELNGLHRRTIICVFGEPDSPPLLGAQTLETFLLGVDPDQHRLVSLEAWWA